MPALLSSPAKWLRQAWSPSTKVGGLRTLIEFCKRQLFFWVDCHGCGGLWWQFVGVFCRRRCWLELLSCHLHSGLGVGVCIPEYLPWRFNESQEPCGSEKVQLPAMHEVNLASGNAWWFGEQQTGMGHIDEPCSVWKIKVGNHLIQPWEASIPHISCQNQGRGGGRNSLLSWVCFYLKWERFPKPTISLFLYLLLTQ